MVVVGLAVADGVTLSRAKPSYDNETRAFNRLLHHHPAPTVATTTPVPAATVPAATVPATDPPPVAAGG